MSSEPTPGEVRPRRTLDRPPSERYAREPASGGAGPGAGSSPANGRLAAIAIAAVGAIAITVLNGLLAITTGLLAVAAVIGYLVGQALRRGGSVGTARTGRSGARAGAAVIMAVASVLVGALGTWLVAIPQGGVLGPADYLVQVMGLLLPALALVAAAGAWLGNR